MAGPSDAGDGAARDRRHGSAPATATHPQPCARTLLDSTAGFNAKIDRALVFELATGRFLERAEDAVFLGPPGTGKSHLAQAIGLAVIHQGHRVAHREVHVLLEELADAALDGTRKEYIAEMASVPLLILDDLRHAQAPGHGCRGPAGVHHAPL